jgi:hypothetical protein
VIGYLGQRLAWAFAVLVGISLAVFLVVHLSGDPTALYARLFAQGVVLQPLTAARAIVPVGLRTRHTFSGAEATLEADTVVLSFGGKANDGLYHELDGRVPELRMVGDAVSSRRIHDALLDGTRAARAL